MENLQQQDKSDKSTEEKFMLVKEKKQCNLREYVNIHKNFKIRQENILDLTKGILRNLQLVHSQNKIYYDLKLENIHVIYNDEQELMKSEIIQVVLNGFDKSKIMENEEVFIKKTSTHRYLMEMEIIPIKSIVGHLDWQCLNYIPNKIIQFIFKIIQIKLQLTLVLEKLEII